MQSTQFDRRKQLIGLSLAIAGAILFSAKAIVAKLLYQYQLDAVTVIAFRMLFSLPVFGAIAWWQSRQQAPLASTDRWRLVGLGFVGYYLSSFLDFLGLQYISAGLERLILFLTPSFVLLIHVWWFKRSIRPIEYLSLGIAYLGIVLVFMHDLSFNGNQVILGAGLVLGSALAYAAYLIQSGEMVARIGSLRLVSYAMCVSSVACILQFLLLKPIDHLIQSWQVVSLSVVNAIACTVFPVFLTMFAIQKIGAPKASQAGMIGPVSTLIFAYIFLNEAITVWQLIGSSLVIVGMYLLSRK
ncbi:DMT family transporter [Undibacterium baiyunense]|uniref:DMT family transporter n=1 Tax=Undibacterium baiyunense TaxID=2828731 RepID=A0A941I390_9BURK|nr:DMT family transporter [Undibacterium baiyunense]MBR7746166.1 DMT family transporter [Undibacterium baiyunense]